MEPRICELCDAEAVVFCPSDAAYLCWTCDAKVHQANFLVARHFRHPLIRAQDSGDDRDVDDLDSLSSSKECSSFAGRRKSCPISSSAKPRPPVGYFKAEDVFMDWIGKIGMDNDRGAVGIGCRGLDVCLNRWKAWPLRLSLAASLCLGLRANSAMAWQALKRLEQLSGVPAKLILAAESRLRGAALRGGWRRVELEEGWAEC